MEIKRRNIVKYQRRGKLYPLLYKLIVKYCEVHFYEVYVIDVISPSPTTPPQIIKGNKNGLEYSSDTLIPI